MKEFAGNKQKNGKKLKVLIHAPNLSTPGGKQTYFSSIKDYFESDISFFFYGAQGRKETGLLFLRRLIGDYFKFYRLLSKGQFDLVHLNPSLNPKSFFRDSIFAFICHLMSVKLVIFWHGWNWEFEGKVIRKILPYFSFTYGKADAMIVLAKEFLNQLKSYGYNKKLYLGTTVVDNSIFDFSDKYFENEKSQHTKDELTILYLARVEIAKGIYETIDSFKQLQAKFPHIKLNIAGTGGELENAKEYVKQRNIPQINFLGWITAETKSQTLCSADIYVFPSSYGEGMPCSILEAMACGLAVVTTDVAGIKDFFINEKMGLYIQAKDVLDLEAKIESLINNINQLKKIRKYNAGYARNHFTPLRVSSRLERIYEDTITENNETVFHLAPE